MELFKEVDNIHLVGIKGVGMSALAQILDAFGFKVRGSDREEEFFTDDILTRQNIEFTEGFSAKNITDTIDLCITSTAYLDSENCNPELRAAQRKGLPVKTYSEVLALLFNRAGIGVAVSGSHGKSTTSAMLGEVVARSELPCFCAVGTEVLSWSTNAKVPRKLSADSADSLSRAEKLSLLSNSVFVVEADEYQESFLNFSPNILVITNLDYDHPDSFKDEQSYQDTFARLIKNTEPYSGLNKKAIKKDPVVVGYKKDEKIRALLSNSAGVDIVYFEAPDEDYELKFPGEHYQLNAEAVFSVAEVLDLDTRRTRAVLEDFQGTRRRFEKSSLKLGQKNLTFIDDYAHHPTEIKAVIESVRGQLEKEKLVVVFQPHTFSRTEALFEEFVEALAGLDRLVLVGTYGSAREKQGRVKSRDLLEALKKESDFSLLRCFPDLKKAADFLRGEMQDQETIITMGAGDVWKIKDYLIQG